VDGSLHKAMIHGETNNLLRE